MQCCRQIQCLRVTSALKCLRVFHKHNSSIQVLWNNMTHSTVRLMRALHCSFVFRNALFPLSAEVYVTVSFIRGSKLQQRLWILHSLHFNRVRTSWVIPPRLSSGPPLLWKQKSATIHKSRIQTHKPSCPLLPALCRAKIIYTLHLKLGLVTEDAMNLRHKVQSVSVYEIIDLLWEQHEPHKWWKPNVLRCNIKAQRLYSYGFR
jgi:hypothetical protein